MNYVNKNKIIVFLLSIMINMVSFYLKIKKMKMLKREKKERQKQKRTWPPGAISVLAVSNSNISFRKEKAPTCAGVAPVLSCQISDQERWGEIGLQEKITAAFSQIDSYWYWWDKRKGPSVIKERQNPGLD